MSDEEPKPLDTVRPPEGDEDVYSASTKVGEASPEILELVRRANEEAALKPARVPGGVGVPAAATEAKREPAATVTEPAAVAGKAAVEDVAVRVAAAAEMTPAPIDAPAPVHTEEGIPPLSLLVLVVAAGIAAWLGYQALHAPAPTPASTPPPAIAP